MKNTALPNYSKLPPRPVFHVVAESDCALLVMVVVMVLLVVGNMRVMMIMEEVETKHPIKSSNNHQVIIFPTSSIIVTSVRFQPCTPPIIWKVMFGKNKVSPAS